MKLKITLFSFLLTAFFLFEGQAQCNGAQYEEQNGIVVIQAENLGISSSWRRESSKAGFTGSSYIIWRGTQYFGSPGNGLIQVKVKINSPGKYRFAWRNTIGILAGSNPSTEHNDTWLKIPDASAFYGEKSNGSRVYPGGTGLFPTAEGNTSGGWFKVYVNNLNWTWDTYTSDFDGHFIFAEFNSPGVYTIQISARSSGHIIDRLVMYKVGSYSFSSATQLSRPETTCGGGGAPPPPPPPPPPPANNNPPTVSITNPSNGQNFSAGSNVTVNLNASDSDGSITKHEIFVNNSLVDTDGAGYSPYVISNIAAGSYAIRARVTDNSGATAESTVNITVGGGNPPPPPPPPPSGGNNPPTVSFVSPSNGQNFSTGSNVSVNVSASDSDGTVVQHQIFVNGALVDTDGSFFTPYVISNIAAGSYAIRALVTDNDGATAESTVNITVGSGNPPPPPPPPGGNNPPSLNILSPSNGQNVAVGSNVSINVSASDSDGTVVKYQIYVNGALVDTDGSFFTPYVINSIAAGSYAIRVVVTDNDGATSESTVNITAGSGGGPGGNNPPSLTILSPSNGQNVAVGSTVSVNVSASDSDGTVVKYQIYVNGVLVDTDGSFFTPHPINNIGAGAYTIRVVVTDDDGATSESTVNITAGGGAGKGLFGENAYIYPNPVKGNTFSVKIPGEVSSSGEVYFRLIDSAGSEVESGKVNVNGEAAEFQMKSFDNRNNGVYYLMLQSNVTSYTVPIIKE